MKNITLSLNILHGVTLQTMPPIFGEVAESQTLVIVSLLDRIVEPIHRLQLFLRQFRTRAEQF